MVVRAVRSLRISKGGARLFDSLRATMLSAPEYVVCNDCRNMTLQREANDVRQISRSCGSPYLTTSLVTWKCLTWLPDVTRSCRGGVRVHWCPYDVTYTAIYGAFGRVSFSWEGRRIFPYPEGAPSGGSPSPACGRVSIMRSIDWSLGVSKDLGEKGLPTFGGLGIRP